MILQNISMFRELAKKPDFVNLARHRTGTMYVIRATTKFALTLFTVVKGQCCDKCGNDFTKHALHHANKETSKLLCINCGTAQFPEIKLELKYQGIL